LESRLCPIGLCNSDCQVSAWSKYSDCSVTCGTGSQRRKRGVTRSAGGSGLPCPHLVESRNCRVQGCNADCKVGAFSPWGSCLPVAATSTQAVVVAQSGKPSSSSCARKRSRPVMTQRAGTGGPCPSLQEFKNCPCPFGAGSAVLPRRVGTGNITGAGGGGGSFGQTAQSWLTSATNTVKKYFAGAQKWWTSKGLGWKSALAIGIVALMLLVCCCGCCCSLLAKCEAERNGGRRLAKMLAGARLQTVRATGM